jgi:hypothetical protein
VVNSGRSARRLARPTGTAHKLVMETAQSMAAEIFDELMKRDEWWKMWKERYGDDKSQEALQRIFIRQASPKLLAGARAVLANLLTTTVDPTLKDQIEDALLLDATLVRRVHG